MHKSVRVILCILCGLTVLWSCQADFETMPFFRVKSALRPQASTIPGNTKLERCDDPLDPADDLFEVSHLLFDPERPTLGHNLTIYAFGRFNANISSNATIFYFVVADAAGVATWGAEEFCNRTTVIQRVDGISRASCPPTKGSAFLKAVVDFPPNWPGRWYVHIDIRDGDGGEYPRLFCVEGDIQVRRDDDDDFVLVDQTPS